MDKPLTFCSACQQWFHIHIPKTAGMAIVKTLGYERRYWHLGHPFPSVQLRQNKICQLTWDAGFKFTVIRDPLDRLASLFFYMQDRMAIRPESLSEFFHTCVPQYTFNYAEPQVRWLTEGIDFILYFETLQTCWQTFCRHLDIPYRPLPLANVGPQLDNYHHLYDAELEEEVRDYYREDYERFPRYNPEPYRIPKE